MSGELIAVGSVADLAQKRSESIENMFFNGVEIIVILDSSASMGRQDAKGEVSRISVATNELQILQNDNPGLIGLIEFSDDVSFCPSGVPKFLRGQTDMAKALNFILPTDDCDFTFVLVSDGEPDDEEETLIVAQKFIDPIHTIYCGPKTSRAGQKFLETLSNLTGGKHNYQGIGELAKPIQNLLTAKTGAGQTIHL